MDVSLRSSPPPNATGDAAGGVPGPMSREAPIDANAAAIAAVVDMFLRTLREHAERIDRAIVLGRMVLAAEIVSGNISAPELSAPGTGMDPDEIQAVLKLAEALSGHAPASRSTATQGEALPAAPKDGPGVRTGPGGDFVRDW